MRPILRASAVIQPATVGLGYLPAGQGSTGGSLGAVFLFQWRGRNEVWLIPGGRQQ